MKKVAVVILNWNGVKHLMQFLPSVVKYSTDPMVDIVLADNGSTDNSIAYVSTNYPDIKIVRLDKNYGFASGYNHALKLVDAEYYVLLNSDVEVTESWIPRMIQEMKNESCVAAMPKIRSWYKTNFFEYAGAAGGYVDYLGYPFCKGRIFSTVEEDKGQYDKNSDVMWVSGACMFIKSEIFNLFEGFDENYFAHMEEIDLCWRIRNGGHKLMCFGNVHVYHEGGGTLSYDNPKKTYLNFRNSLLTVFKNHPSKFVFWYISIRFLLDFVAWIKYAVALKFSSAFAINRAHIYFLQHFREYYLKRRTLQKQKIINAGLFNASIVYRYFIKKQKNFSDLT